MRYSSNVAANVHTFKETLSGKAFCDAVAESTKQLKLKRTGSLLLVGGSSPHDLAVRHAQSVLRWDRLPSYWSHAAIILDWPESASPQQVLGVEVALNPEVAGEQVPERNGATLFRLSR